MRTYILIILAATLLSACGTKQGSSSTTTTGPAASPQSSSQSGGSQSAASQAGGAPVELTSCGLAADKQNVSYKIKVNTAQPIEEVHVALKELDAAGKVLGQMPLVWKNIVGSTRQPIENGKTYDDQSPLEPGVAKIDCSLGEVVFKDGTSWKPK
jgi:hypothetical protein